MSHSVVMYSSFQSLQNHFNEIHLVSNLVQQAVITGYKQSDNGLYR